MPSTLAAILLLFGICLGVVAGTLVNDVDARKLVLILAMVIVVLAVLAEIAPKMWR